MNKKIAFISALLGFLVTPLMVFAIDPNTWVLGIIQRLLGMVVWPVFVGAVIIMFIYAGFMFLTAHGEPAKIKSAREAVVWALVGIVVAIFAYSAVTFVRNIVAPINQLSGASCTVGGPPNQCVGGPCMAPGVCP